MRMGMRQEGAKGFLRGRAAEARKRTVQSDDEEPRAYADLTALLGGDDRRIKLILDVFHRSARMDLHRMERAAVAAEWSLVRKLALRMAIGCRQVGEERMAALLAAEVGRAIDRVRRGAAPDPDTFGKLFADTRRELIEVLDRAAAHASEIGQESMA